MGIQTYQQPETILMSEPATPNETTMTLSDTKQHLSEVVNRVARGETRVIVQKSGLPVAAIISVEEYRRFKAHEQPLRARRATVHEALGRFSDGLEGIPDEKLERELAQAQAQAELRAEREASARG